MKKVFMVLFFLGVSLFNVNLFAQCDFEFNPAGGTFEPGDEVSVRICYQDESSGVPDYAKADWSDNNTTWDITVTGDDGTGISISALGSGNDMNSTYCARVIFHAGSSGTIITIRAQATGENAPNCDADRTQGYTLLPIVLKSFDVTSKGNTAFLDWVTMSEINNDYFTIEMSLNGDDFKSIGEVQGAGDSRELLDYSFAFEMDEGILSEPFVYFRLKQTDFDGLYSYSEVVLLTNKTKNKSAFNISKAYSGGSDIHFDVTAMESNSLQAKIFDYSGNVITSKTIDVNAGINSFEMPVNNDRSAIYILQVINGDIVKTKKVFLK